MGHMHTSGAQSSRTSCEGTSLAQMCSPEALRRLFVGAPSYAVNLSAARFCHGFFEGKAGVDAADSSSIDRRTERAVACTTPSRVEAGDVVELN